MVSLFIIYLTSPIVSANLGGVAIDTLHNKTSTLCKHFPMVDTHEFNAHFKNSNRKKKLSFSLIVRSNDVVAGQLFDEVDIDHQQHVSNR